MKEIRQTASEEKKDLKESLKQALALSKSVKNPELKNIYAKQASAIYHRLATCKFNKTCPCCNIKKD